MATVYIEVCKFIDILDPFVKHLVRNTRNCCVGLKRIDIENWCKRFQPNMDGIIRPRVVNYFCNKYGINCQ